MKNLLYLIGLIAIAAVIISVMKTDETTVDMNSDVVVEEAMTEGEADMMEADAEVVEEAMTEGEADMMEADAEVVEEAETAVE